jgi:hypothetical protein
MCLRTDGEESALHRHPNSRVYPLPWSYCCCDGVSSNMSFIGVPIEDDYVGLMNAAFWEVWLQEDLFPVRYEVHPRCELEDAVMSP